MEYCRWQESEDGKELIVHAVVKDEQIFGSKLRLTRELKVSTEKNEFRICDVIENTGSRTGREGRRSGSPSWDRGSRSPLMQENWMDSWSGR